MIVTRTRIHLIIFILLISFLLIDHQASGLMAGSHLSFHYNAKGESPRTSLVVVSMSSPQQVLDGEENLKALFERAVVLQRTGGRENLVEALKSYERFIKAAKSTNQDPKMYAEVYVNMGAIYLKEPLRNREMAIECFLQAIQHRKVGTAYVNLALLTLQQGSESRDPQVGQKALDGAKEFCDKALELNQDPRSVAMAKKLLQDIQRMNQQMGR
jgi:tetratricopeptide (TPR) repeat protein